MSEASQYSPYDALLPITCRDSDVLGRAKLAEHIGSIITNLPKSQSSVVFGVYGAWGEGKTSLINMVKECALEECAEDECAEKECAEKNTPPPIIIHFNPWYFSGQDQLLEQFLKELASGIRSGFQKAKGRIDNAVEIANQIADGILKLWDAIKPAVEVIKPGTSLIIKPIKKIVEHIKKTTDQNKEDKFNPHELKKQINKRLSELDRPILIIIDDIDRLTKEEIREMLRLVKGVADFTNTIYLLSFDPQEVYAALKDVQTHHPERYVEKIVQHHFSLPTPPQGKIFEECTKHLNRIITKDWDDSTKEHWRTCCFSGGFKFYFKNLREVYRFLIVFRSTYTLLKNEVNDVDVIVMTALHTKHYAFHQFIQEHQHIFARDTDPYRNEQDQERDQSIYAHFRQQQGENPDLERVEKLLMHLFPDCRDIILGARKDDSHGGFYEPDKGDLERNQRIARSRYYRRYFAAAPHDDQLSDGKKNELIALQDQPCVLHQEMNLLYAEQKKDVIDFFSLHSNKIQAAHYVHVARALVSLVEESDEPKHDRGFTYSERVLEFIRGLFASQNNMEQHIAYYQALFNAPECGLYAQCLLLVWLANALNIREDNQPIDTAKLAAFPYKTAFTALHTQVQEAIKVRVDDGTLQQHKKWIDILSCWSVLSSHEMQTYGERLLNTDDGLIAFVMALDINRYKNDNFTIAKHKLTRDVTSCGINFDVLTQRLQDFKDSASFAQCSEQEQDVTQILINAINGDSHA